MPIENIEDLANAPAKARTAEGEVVERSLNSIIEADRYLRAKEATDAGPPFGMSIARISKGPTV